MEVVDKIAEDAKPIDDDGFVSSANQPVIESIKVID